MVSIWESARAVLADVPAFVCPVAPRAHHHFVVTPPVKAAPDDPLREVRCEVAVGLAIPANAELALTLAIALSRYVLPEDPVAIVEEYHLVLTGRSSGFFNEFVQHHPQVIRSDRLLLKCGKYPSEQLVFLVVGRDPLGCPLRSWPCLQQLLEHKHVAWNELECALTFRLVASCMARQPVIESVDIESLGQTVLLKDPDSPLIFCQQRFRNEVVNRGIPEAKWLKA